MLSTFITISLVDEYKNVFLCYNLLSVLETDGSASIELQPKYPRRIEAPEEHGSISSSDDFDELAFADGLSHPFGLVSTSTGVSKWQLKGKRNSRSLGKKYLDRTEAEVSGGYMNGRNTNWSNSGFRADMIHNSFRNHVSGYRSRGLRSSKDLFDSEGTRGYWEDSCEYVDPSFVCRHGRTMLLDVDLKVQANNYRRDVPMISLMSKLNGHAIIGHPIQIEALESGLTENLFPAADNFRPGPREVPATLPSAWRTGRRTANFRVPRPFLSLTLNGESKQHRQLTGQKGNMAQRSFYQYPVDKKSSRSSPKKISPSSNQKIRTLSSIASDQQHQSDPRNEGSNSQVDGLIKTDNASTAIACIPIKLVFSRLNEELVGRHHQ